MSRHFFNRKTITEDVTAGLVLGIESVPDGLAQGLLAAVNPIYGLYAYMTGTLSGALFTSSAFMAVQATSAMSLIVASVPQVHVGDNADAALFALAIITGVFMLAAGLLKLGQMLRFVPNAVMVGFVNAVAVLIILGQLGDFTGYDAVGGNKVAQTFDLLRNLDQILIPTLLIGIVTIVLIITLEKTSLGALGMVAAIIIASLLVYVAGWEEVATVSEIADIPDSLPRPTLPPLSVIPALIIPALSLAFVGLVQGAGVSKNYVNPDGEYPDASGDFTGQGVANIVAGLFQGMPVGGSVSATALVTNAGAKSRTANIVAGLVIALVILLFASAVGYIALPAISGLLIVVGFRTIKPDQIRMVLKTGRIQQVVMIITFAACLLIPLQYAVLIGVVLSVLLFFFEQSNQIEVKAWDYEPGELPTEYDAPENVPSEKVTIIVPYGSVFYATAPVIEEKLPNVTDKTHNAVIILALRSEQDLGSTFLDVLGRYSEQLQAQNSKLVLAEVTSQVRDQLNQTKIGHTIGRENIYARTEKFGETIIQAWDDGHKWLAEQPEVPDPEPEKNDGEQPEESDQEEKSGQS